MGANAQLRGNNTQATLGAERLGLRVIVPVSASERLQLFVSCHVNMTPNALANVV